jgi:hypothetical protein
MQGVSLDRMDRVREGADVQAGAKVAPEAFARAEQERAAALSARAGGDTLAAELHAEHAMAAYEHAVIVARLARATTELADAQKALGDATARAQEVDASRASLERDADALEQRLHAARDRVLPAVSAAATGDREAARLVAARSMTVEARLLCDAAGLVAESAVGLPEASAEVAKLEARVAGPKTAPAPIDDAARARARCLDVLTRARRAEGGDASASDTLLAELSAAGGWDPVRDERGVVVTLHDAFRGGALASEADKRLQELGRVSSAHPAFGLEVVVHDAVEPSGRDGTDLTRSLAATQALVTGGAAKGRVKAELAGARAPIVDPSDAKARGRNERLDVVFVAAGR